MKTKTLATLAVCASITVMASQSHAKEQLQAETSTDYWKNIYFKIDVAQRYSSKISGLSKRPKVSNVFGVGIGYSATTYPARIEFTMQGNNLKTSAGPDNWLKTRMQLYMLSVYRNFALPENKRIVPYLTMGIGYAVYNGIKGQTTSSGNVLNYSHGRTSHEAVNAGAGIKFDLSKIAAIDIGFKYLYLGHMPGMNSAKNNSSYQGSISLLLSFF